MNCVHTVDCVRHASPSPERIDSFLCSDKVAISRANWFQTNATSQPRSSRATYGPSASSCSSCCSAAFPTHWHTLMTAVTTWIYWIPSRHKRSRVAHLLSLCLLLFVNGVSLSGSDANTGRRASRVRSLPELHTGSVASLPPAITRMCCSDAWPAITRMCCSDAWPGVSRQRSRGTADVGGS